MVALTNWIFVPRRGKAGLGTPVRHKLIVMQEMVKMPFINYVEDSICSLILHRCIQIATMIESCFACKAHHVKQLRPHHDRSVRGWV